MSQGIMDISVTTLVKQCKHVIVGAARSSQVKCETLVLLCFLVNVQENWKKLSDRVAVPSELSEVKSVLSVYVA